MGTATTAGGGRRIFSIVENCRGRTVLRTEEISEHVQGVCELRDGDCSCEAWSLGALDWA
jgi:hypothetical protein